MAELNAITRKEKFLAKAAGEDVETPEPITRKEKFLAKAAGLNVETPEPITREEMFLSKITGGTGGGGGGGSSVSPKDVNFYDYDGTLLHSYTVAEAQALSELPPLPTQKGLVCQGWNWTLDDIKAHNRAVDVGATYITDDGKTRLYIKIAAEGRMDVPLYFQQTVANGVTIDWGDGSTTETLSGTGKVNTVHTYASIGEYVISLDVVDGCELGLGHKTPSYCVLGSTGNNGLVYCNMLQKVEVGNGVTSIGDYAFYNCCSLASITIPDGVTSIGANAFNTCYSLASLVISDSVTSIFGRAFYNCFSLSGIVIPNSVTSIGGSAFYYCYALASITIPNSVTSISESALQYCYALASITIPNSVTSIYANTFYNCFSLSGIVIPNSITGIGKSAFSGCRSLESIVIPDGVTSIGDSKLQGCYSLASITIPDGVTSIGRLAFADCFGVKFYDFTSHTSVPTLAHTSAFTNIPSDCEIRVPAALYDEWIAATNWSTYADYIVAV